MRWQRKARALVAAVAIGVAVAVVLAFKPGPAPAPVTAIAPADPKALVESESGDKIRIDLDKEVVRVKYDSYTAYPDGTLKAQNVRITSVRDGGRTFVVSGKHADVTQNETNYNVIGDVRITASDGLEARTERATYTEADGLVRAPGPIEFNRGRLAGSSVGLTYAKRVDVLTLHEKVVVHFAPDAAGGGAAEITSSAAEFSRVDHILRFTGGMTVTRGAKTIAANSGVAYLSDDEQRLETIELRGQSSMVTADSAVGGLRSARGQNIDLKYHSDGETLEQAHIIGDAVAHVAGESEATDRVITATALDVTLAPDGATPTALSARENVELTIPAGKDTPRRLIRAQSLDGQGEADRGLTRARFTGGVRFEERGGKANRTGQSAALNVTLAPGLREIEDARFEQAVRFEEGRLIATSAMARYVLAKGTLELTGTEPVRPVPQVVNDKLSVYATRIDVTLSGPTVTASGAVKSELKPARDDSAETSTRMPSMFKPDQLVAATAGELLYDGTASKAVYSGNAVLWQGDTSIKANTIGMNEKSGDLTASGSVVTTIMLEQESKEKRKERVPTTASSKEFNYEEASRRATYMGDAQASGPQGVISASRLELYLSSSGDKLERVEAYDRVTLRDQNRETTGLRMSYFAEEQRYVVTGTPIVIKDGCGTETTGKRVTYDRRNDTVVVDGLEQVRTRTRGGAKCS